MLENRRKVPRPPPPLPSSSPLSPPFFLLLHPLSPHCLFFFLDLALATTVERHRMEYWTRTTTFVDIEIKSFPSSSSSSLVDASSFNWVSFLSSTFSFEFESLFFISAFLFLLFLSYKSLMWFFSISSSSTHNTKPLFIPLSFFLSGLVLQRKREREKWKKFLSRVQHLFSNGNINNTVFFLSFSLSAAKQKHNGWILSPLSLLQALSLFGFFLQKVRKTLPPFSLFFPTPKTIIIYTSSSPSFTHVVVKVGRKK